MSPRKILGLLLVLAALAGIALLLLGPEAPAEWPPPPEPAEDAGLDPALVERIDETLAEIEADPTGISPRARLGMIYEANELYPLASETYRQLAERAEADGEIRYRLARSLEREGLFDEAIAALEDAVSLMGRPGRHHDLLVDWLLQAGRLDEAARVVATAGELPLAEARLQVARDRLDEAEEKLRSSGLLDGDRARPALFLLARIERRRGQLEAARATSERALAAPPSPLHPWDVGMAGHRVGASSLRTRAQNQISAGDFQGALETLQTLRDQPGGDDPRIAGMIAHCFLQLGHPALAIRTLEATVRAHPDSSSAHLNLAKSHLVGLASGASAASLERAAATVEEALRLRPEWGEAWSAKGQVLEASGSLEEALEAYRRSWEADSGETLARVRAAWIHLARTEWARAREVLVSVADGESSAPSALLARARAEAELGNLGEARQLLAWVGDRLPGEATDAVRDRIDELQSNAG